MEALLLITVFLAGAMLSCLITAAYFLINAPEPPAPSFSSSASICLECNLITFDGREIAATRGLCWRCAKRNREAQDRQEKMNECD